MQTLDEIALKHGTDKSSAFHGYCDTYERILGPLREAPVRLLELGVLGGDSIRMWADFFDHPDATIKGIDIELHRCKPMPPGDKRIVIEQASQTDHLWWDHQGPFDIIIDDASHFASQQIHGFNLGWPRVQKGGLYIIEDLHTAWSEQHSNAAMTIMEFLHGMTCELMARGASARAQDARTDIASVEFYHGLAVIRKL